MTVNEALPAFYLRFPTFLALLLLTTALTGCGTVEKSQPTQPQSSPATLSEIRPVSKMSVDTLVANGSPLGIYDRAVIEKIRNRWFQALEGANLPSIAAGKATVEFKLHADGQISEVKITENTTNTAQSVLCQKAIEDSAPFPPWSAEVRQQISEDYRKIKFTFYYH